MLNLRLNICFLQWSSNRLFLIALLSFFMLVGPFPLHADWYIMEKREDDFGNFSVQSIFISGEKIRIEQSTSSLVFNVETARMMLLFPKQMVYWEGHHDSLSKGLFDAVERQMRSMMYRLSEEEQQQVERELMLVHESMTKAVADTLLPANTSIILKDSVQEINGFQSVLYEFNIDSIAVERLWITHDIQPYATLSLKQLHEMMRIFSKPSLLSTLRESAVWLDLLQTGLVMRSEIPQSPGNSRMLVESVKETTIPEMFFQAPDDYRQAGVHEIIRIMMGDDDPLVEPSGATPIKPPFPENKSRHPGGSFPD